MIISFLLLTLLGPISLIKAASIPTVTRPQKPNLILPRHGTIQTPTLVSDFKKNNISASWAPGQPQQWGQEVKKFQYPIVKDPGAKFVKFYSAVSSDEKFIVLFNTTDFKIVSLDNNNTVTSVGKVPFPRDIGPPYVLAKGDNDAGGGYDLFISGSNETYASGATIRYGVTSLGVLTGQQVVYRGRTTDAYLKDSTAYNVLSKDRKRMLTADFEYRNNVTRGTIYVHTLSSSPDTTTTGTGTSTNLTIHAHTDYVTSTSFSPDGKTISTISYDQTGALWDSTTGTLIRRFPALSGLGQRTSFSPDGRYVLMAAAPDTWDNTRLTYVGDLHVHIYSVSSDSTGAEVANIRLGPDVLTGELYDGFTMEWAPDSKTVAIGTYGALRIYSLAERTFVQEYVQEDTSPQMWDILWLEGGKRLVWRIGEHGLTMYDFETNQKFWWGPGDMDHWLDSYDFGSTVLLPKRGWIGGTDSDQMVRFWKYTA